MDQEVLNQAPPLLDYNLYAMDRPLRDAVTRENAGWAHDHLTSFGHILGTAEAMEWATQANEYPPVLRTHDRWGRRRDEVEFHPAWHNLMFLAVEQGIHSSPWSHPRAGCHAARAAHAILAAENEAGHMCPISMTYSSVPVLRKNEAVAREWMPLIASTQYDQSFCPASEKRGVILGMAMTEKQGGSDVRANVTRAEPMGGGEYALYGHKWFCSAPMSDAFLVLAQAPRGLACFLVPRWKPDDTLNAIRLQRLKSKLGNRSNASSEVEYEGAWAQIIGEEGRGVATIMEMVQHTRLDCILASTGLMRRAFAEALHHAAYRQAFGRTLIDQPAMRGVLADLAIESEAATVLAMRLARAFDEDDHAFARLAVAAGKYWITKRAPNYIYEALECIGGNGYVEECVFPRLYREAPVNAIWEGSGNVIALDVLRAIAKEPESLERVVAEIRAPGDRRLDSLADGIGADLSPASARRVAERLTLSLQASLLLRFSPAPVAEAFCASRIGRDWGQTFGTLPFGANLDGILSAAMT